MDRTALTAPTWVVNDGDVPVSDVLSVAVIVPDAPEVCDTVYTTVAVPLASVFDVADANEPPDAAVDQVTTLLAVDTALPSASCNCAVTVTDPPAVGVVDDSVTAYRVAVPGLTVNEFE
ncbi:MAG: hypothetical protein ACO39Q_09695, partial [Ilumatobacteraceae bacterium]